jgi:hypothetical protein
MNALQARYVRLLAGLPLEEVNRLWRIESLEGFAPLRPVSTCLTLDIQPHE